MIKSIKMLVIAGGLLLACAPTAQAQDAAALAPIQQFVDGMNSGDIKSAGDAYTPVVSIIDEFAPVHWTSFGAWLSDAGAFFKANAVTGLHIAGTAPSFKVMGADTAYAVVPTTLTYLAAGKPASEKGLFTYSLTKTGSGWRINGWTWSTL